MMTMDGGGFTERDCESGSVNQNSTATEPLKQLWCCDAIHGSDSYSLAVHCDSL